MTKPIHKDLLIAKDFVYDYCNFICTKPEVEPESEAYNAYTFKINSKTVKYRIAKITPTKTGQFVTFWKRSDQGPIAPFHIAEEIDFFIVSVRDGNSFGQFIFPKKVLHEKGILSDDKKEGKRAFRVYPPWDITFNLQAQKTQQWQLNYFFEINLNDTINFEKVKQLFNE